MSAKTTDNHPAVFLLYPAGKDAGAEPKLVSKPDDHWVLFVRLAARAGDKKAVLPFGLTFALHCLGDHFAEVYAFVVGRVIGLPA